jgi:hypothetical protein
MFSEVDLIASVRTYRVAVLHVGCCRYSKLGVGLVRAIAAMILFELDAQSGRVVGEVETNK